MNHLTMKSTDLTQVNISKIAELFPNVITEARDEQGKIKRAIDFDLLKQELSDVLVEGEKERYQLTWPGKKEAILTANMPIDKTLRPVKEDSIDWESTQNIYIEGDNLEVLKLLQESYLNKIKCIYIDPPYNTGKDFIYKDNFKEPVEEYLEESGQLNDEGMPLFQNTESNGRFHSDWLTMMYSRLKIARNLLTEDGVIFISIGQNEVSNLQVVCNNIFGIDNLIGMCSRLMKSGGNKGRFFSPNIDYILIYAKDINYTRNFKGEMSEELVKKVYNQLETTGNRAGEYYRSMGLYQSSLDSRPNQRYWIQCPDGSLAIPPGDTFPEIKSEGNKVKPVSSDGVWRWTYEKYHEEFNKGNVEFKETTNNVLLDENGKPSKWNIYTKIWLKDRQDEGQTPVDIITKYENRHSAKELIALGIPFDFPKPSDLIKYLIFITQQDKDSIILDFFSGSASTAHAVMQLNAEDGGNRKFIMVQLPEKTEEDSEAYKAGLQTICEIGKERIRRAAKKIKDETGATIDYGFRVYRVDSSNMKDVYYTPDKLGQLNLDEMASNIREDRTGEDLLIQVMLECGLELSLPMESRVIDGKTVHYVAGNSLIACFDDEVSELVIKKIGEDQPLRVVFRDSSFRDDSARINVEELFKLLSPSTEIQVL